MKPPVIAIDGPSGSGKGAVGERVARALGWHYLDSGAIYRALAVAAVRVPLALGDVEALGALAHALPVRFRPQPLGPPRLFLANEDINELARSQEVGTFASKIAAFVEVRSGLLAKQRELRRPPGLVADGRDMGTVVFPDSLLKVFLTASAEIRAQRRLKQLKEKGLNVTLPQLLDEIRERDARDAGRAASPLKPASEAYLLDTSTMSIDEVVEAVLVRARERLK